MSKRGLVVLTAALATASAGCFFRRPALRYELRTAGGAGGGPELLYPPQHAGPARPYRFSLRLASRPECRALTGSFHAPALGLDWSLADRRLSVVIAPQISSFGNSLPVDLLRGINALRSQLDQAVASGCLAPAREDAALRRAATDLPIAPNIAQALILGAYATQKYIDIADPVQLELTYALRSDQPDRYDLGYAALTYKMAPRDASGRGQLQLVSSVLHDAAAGQSIPPSPIQIADATSPRFFRLFFLLRRSAADHDVALLTAANRPALDQATELILSRAAACGTLPTAGAACRVMPRDVGLEARLRVQVQGRSVTVPVTATVGSAITGAGVRDPSSVLPTLRVLRPYRASYAEVAVPGSRRDLLGLLLIGGERISW